MKIHYINILLFELPLNILIYNQRNHYITRTPKATTRTLCECELYAPSNYDNDPQMKEVMDNFNRQTQQRFHEYDERMVEKRMQCKDKCDEAIQKIILKDKLEKQMVEQFSTLQTDIHSDAIPTCVCEKSLADKTEKFCLNCGKTMGGVAPGWGLVSGLGYVGWTNYITEIAIQKGIEEGVKYGIQGLKNFFGLGKLITITEIENLINRTNYFKKMTYVIFTQKIKNTMCEESLSSRIQFCSAANFQKQQAFSEGASTIAETAEYMAEVATTDVLEKAAPVTSGLNTAIIASVVAILVIVLVMLIIYLILRYRRKKKMKKKLQYIKLLEE
ncbi:rifin [Plasmodium falciparum NF54]|uniref:Rifin n=2 Tax=Plasmodium falciparum TaxID=5833 RepID=A0A143ZWN4_PLAF7|nr:rifin [Plasmodium falciparum 3D7]KAF4326735.1 rifin [Plasmodium falciparum NF54]PKC42076.1 rifin [Plasmodium falciparum NF54]CZT62657.1 rifin [Plasmodium falciparum 3D7]|eukprot:XP_024329036.1 rifin [Plasmodium falciparum 3D7]